MDSPGQRRVTTWFLTIIFLGTCLEWGMLPLWSAGRVPIVQKKKKGNAHTQETFVGKIKSIDSRERVLVLTPIEGDQEEAFEYKKGVRITSVHQAGELKPSDLKVGMLITVYIKLAKASSEIYQILIM